MRLTIKDLAKKCGVSVATISRALNPATQSLVKAQTLDKIKQKAHELGYSPQRLARALREGKSRTIGILMNFRTDTISGYVGEILRGSLVGLQEIGYDLKLISREEFHSLQTILNYAGVDGIILTHAYSGAFPHLKEEFGEKEGPCPVVIINDYTPRSRINQLYVDSYKASKAMAEYLVKVGYRNFYLIGGEENSPDALARKKAFLDTLKEIGIEFQTSRIFNGNFSEEGGYKAVATILKNDSQFRGVFYCLNDAMAIGALRVIGEFNLICPRDVKVIGFDGISQTLYTNPALTTVKFPLFEMGYEAVILIYKLIQGKIKKYVKREFHFELIVRNSC